MSGSISELLPATLDRLVNLDTCIFVHPKVDSKPGSNAPRQRVAAVERVSLSFCCKPLLMIRNHRY